MPLTSTVAGTFTVSASLGDSAAVTAQVTFVADVSTARLVIETSSDATTANGTDSHLVTLKVKDAQGNALNGVHAVSLDVPAAGPLFSNGGMSLSSNTESNGELEVPLTSTMAGTFTVSARLGNGTPVTAQVTFAADLSTARLIIETSADTRTATGTDPHPVTLKVVDAQNNPLAGVHAVTLSVPADGPLFSNNTATLSTSTESNGELEVPLTSTVVGTFTVSARLGSGAAVSADVTFVRYEVYTATISLSPETDGTDLHREVSIAADGTAQTRVVVVIKDQDQRPATGLTGLKIKADQSLLKDVTGGVMTAGTEYDLVASSTDGVYYKTVVAGTDTGSVRFSVTAGLTENDISITSNSVTVNLTAGEPSDAGVYLSSERDGTNLASTTSLAANGSDETRIVIVVKDANGHGVTGLEDRLRIKADTGGLLSTVAGTEIAAETEYGNIAAGTVAGVYYLTVKAGTTLGTVKFRVTSGLSNNLIPPELNSVTVNLTAGIQSVAGIYLSSETDGTALERAKSLVADGNSRSYTRIVVTVKDANGHGINDAVPQITALSGSGLLKNAAGVSITEGTAFNMARGTADGVYYLSVWAQTTSGTVKFSVTGGLNDGVIPAGQNTVTVNLTAGDPSVAGIYLSSETDGTALAESQSLVANGSSYTRVVVKVEDANGNGVNDLSLKIAAQSGGGLLRNANNVSMAEGTDFDMVPGTEDGVYYLSVWAGTTSGTVTFSVTDGLDAGVIPSGSNTVTVNLTAGAPSVAGIYLSSEADGTELERTASLVAVANSNYTRVVVTVKDANGNGVDGLQNLKIAAQSGGGLLTSGGVLMTQGTDFNLIAGEAEGVYYLNVWSGNTTGTVTFSVTGGLNPGVIPTGNNNVTVNLTAGDPSVAGIYLSSETDGTALAQTTSLVANGSSYTRVVVTVKDANGNGVNGLQNLKIAAQSGSGLLRNANGVSMTQGTDFNLVAGTGDGVYYLSVWSRTTTGAVKFSVTGGLDTGLIPTGSNNVTVNLTAGAPSVAGIYLSSEMDGTALASTKSLVANGSSYTRVVVTVKDVNGNGVDGLPLKIAAQSGGGLLTSGNVAMTQGTNFDMIAGGTKGVYYLNVWSRTTTGAVKFSVTGGLNPGVIPTGSNTVTVNLTAGDPSVAGIYLSSETDGTALAESQSLVANGSSYTRVVVKVEDANGNGVNDLSLKIAAQSGGGLLRNANNVSMAEGTDFDMVPGTEDGVYYLSVWAGTTSGTVTFSVTDGLDAGVIPSGSNTVTVNLTAGAPSVAGIYLSSEADGTELERTASLVAVANSNYTRVVVTVKDANGNGVDGLQNLKIAAQSGGGLLTSGGVLMTQGTDFNLIAGEAEGVYYLNVWSGNTTGTVTFSVTGGLNPGVIPTGNNNVTVNLTAGDPSVAGIYLSSETDGTALAQTTSLVANGSSYTRVVVTVKDANGNGVNGLQNLKIAAQSGSGLLRNANGVSMTQGTDFNLVAGTGDGVYYLSVWSRTTTGAVKFSVTGGLDTGLIPTGSNNVTVNLTAGAPSSANTSIRLSSRTDGTALVTSTSLVANGSNETKVVITVKDANGNPVKGLTGLRIKAGTGSLLKDTDGNLIAAGTEYSLASTTDGVYYKTVKAGTTAGSVRFWVSNGLPVGTISDANNGVTVNLTAGAPSSANTSIRLSSRTDGTALVTSASLLANGSNETKVVITVKDANGNPVKGLTGLRIKAGTSSLLKNTDGTLITAGTEYSLTSTTDGVYYKTVKAGTTAGSVRFWVSYGLPGGTISDADNGVTVTLTVPPPASAQVNAWWSYQGGSNRGSTYRTFGSAVRFLNSSGTPMQCDSVTVVGTSGVGYRAEASSVRDLYSYSADKWNNSTSDNEGSNSFNSSTKVYTFTKYSHIGVTGKQGVTYSGVLAASGYMTYPINGQGYLGGDDRITFSCKVGSTTYSFKSSNGMTVSGSLGI